MLKFEHSAANQSDMFRTITRALLITMAVIASSFNSFNCRINTCNNALCLIYILDSYL